MRLGAKTVWYTTFALTVGCGHATTEYLSEPRDFALAGVYPGACGWLRVDADGNRRRTERTFQGVRLMTEVTFDESDRTRIVRSRRFVYDTEGKRIRVEAFDAAQRSASEFSYDARGRWVSAETHATGQRDERFYDDAGQMTARRVVSTRDGHVLKLHTFERDEHGDVVSERIDFPATGRSERIEFSRDDDAGVLERLTHRSPKDALEQRDVYTFSPSGHLATMVRYGDVRLTQHYRRDDPGNLLRVDTWDDRGEPIAATVYDYSCWHDELQ